MSIYVCGPTVYDLPHIGHGRYNLVFDVLRRYLLFSGLAVHYVSNVTDVDDNIIKRANEQGRTEPEVAGGVRSAVVGGDGRARPLAARRHAARHGLHRRHGRPDRRPDGQGRRLRDVRRRLPERRTGRRLRAAGPPEPRIAARRRPCGRERGEAITPRLRVVEEGQGRRALLGRALGCGPAGMAHRVRRDVARSARRRLRPARRGAGPGLPAPRERAGPGRRRGPAVRPPLGAQRLGRGRGHEDVEVARQFHLVDRPARPVRRPGLPHAWCCGRTTARPSR